MSNDLAITYDIFIGAPVDKVWTGIIDGEMTKHYVYGTRLKTTLKEGSHYAYLADGDFSVVDGEILEVEPEKRLLMTWKANWDESVAKDNASQVLFEISPRGASVTRLQVTHSGFEGKTATYTGSIDGWPFMLSSLKSLLETGKPLELAGNS